MHPIKANGIVPLQPRNQKGQILQTRVLKIAKTSNTRITPAKSNPNTPASKKQQNLAQ